jgi:hypothetical protein
MSDGWIKRPKGTKGLPAGLDRHDLIHVWLAGEPVYHPEAELAMIWNWADGPGQIDSYRVLARAATPATPAAKPAGVGDVNGTTLGSAARFNASKPDLSLIPAGIMARYLKARETRAACSVTDWSLVLMSLGTFQMSGDKTFLSPLLDALYEMDNDGKMWAECARVFDYGRQKYSAWNWARGQAWSIPIASALRHIVFGTAVGETLDPESGLPHRGHIACNIVMLLWFIEHYPQGDDRFSPPALPHS